MLQAAQEDRRAQNLKVCKGAYPALGRSRLRMPSFIKGMSS